jgi:hypothetical protein
MTYYNLQDYSEAKEEFEKGAKMATASFIKESQIWRRLELTCRALGLEKRGGALRHSSKAFLGNLAGGLGF